MASVLLGLTLTACGGSPSGDEGAGTSSSSTSAPGTMSDTSSTTMVGVDTDGEEVGTAYGGPGFDTSPPEEETAGSSTTAMGDSTGTETGTGTGTGTGTETGTGTGTGTSTSGQ